MQMLRREMQMPFLLGWLLPFIRASLACGQSYLGTSQFLILGLGNVSTWESPIQTPGYQSRGDLYVLVALPDWPRVERYLFNPESIVADKPQPEPRRAAG